jgi:hypothetical protein
VVRARETLERARARNSSSNPAVVDDVQLEARIGRDDGDLDVPGTVAQRAVDRVAEGLLRADAVDEHRYAVGCVGLDGGAG